MDPVPAAIRQRYTVIEALRSGPRSASARLLRARQDSTGQEVVVKLLELRLHDDESARAEQIHRFHREARFCADLHHPNIVPLVDFGETDEGQPFAVFSFIPGTDLGGLLATEGALDPPVALHLMTQVMDALSCAHASGIVHRDLKPENIMISKTGARRNALVLDFGIGTLAAGWSSAVASRVTPEGEYLGTPAYSAPEQLRGGPPDLRSDLYTWGIIFLELLTGRQPLGASSPYEMIHRHLGPEDVSIPQPIEGTALGDILRAVTRKPIDERTITSAEVLDALQRVTTLPDRDAFRSPVPSDARGPRSGQSVTPRLGSSWLVPWVRNPNFTGRAAALRWVHDTLHASRPVSVVALHGLGGVGKTQVALEYAYRNAGSYRLVAWIHAEQPESIAAGYAEIAHALRLPERPTEREVIESVRSWLERHDEWLLVFDNARNPASIRGHLPRWHRGHILVTSRHPGWRDLAAAFPLDVLARDEAVEFLLRRTAEADGEHAGRLADELGALPLALEEAAAYIDATGRTLADYLTLLQRQRSRAASATKLHEMLEQAWELSFREIEQQAPASFDLLRVCAFLGPDDIPDTLFRAQGASSSDARGIALGDDFAFDACVAPLRRYSLVRRERDSLTMHRLVQLAIRERLPDAEQARWAGVALGLVEARYPSKAIAGDSVPESRRLLPHALSVLSHAACDETHPGMAARVLRRTAIYLSTRGLHDQAREQLERALALFKRAGETDRSQLGGTLWELGMVLYAIGEGAAARESLGEAATLLEAAGGQAGEVFYPQCLVSLAWVQRTLGDFEGTVATARRSVEHVQRTSGPNHPRIAMGLAPLARAEWSLNRMADCRESAKRAVDILEGVRNPLPILCGSWYALAQVHLDLGLFDDAFRCARRGLAIGEPAFGSDHPLVCLNVRVTGGVHLRRGDLPAAQRDLRAAIEGGQRACRYLHEDIAIARSELAGAVHGGAESEAAIGLLRHGLDGLDSLCGDPARFEGETRAILARVLHARGELMESIEQSRAGLGVLAARYGDAHPVRIGALNALGWTLRDVGRGDEARAAFAEAVKLADAAGLQEHPDRAVSLRALASVTAQATSSV